MKKKAAVLAGMLLALGLAVVGGWALLPEARADPRDAFVALRDAARAHGLAIAGVESAPRRPLPVAVAWHPRRLLRSLQARQGRQLAPEGEGAARYSLADASGSVAISAELQQREGAVVWIWLDGPEEEARRVKAVRGALRAALPWVPVSCPWQ